MFSGGISTYMPLNIEHHKIKDLFHHLERQYEKTEPKDSNIKRFQNPPMFWDIYSQKYKAEHGKTLTIQLLKSSFPLVISTFILKIFDNNGNRLAYASEFAHLETESYTSPLTISKTQKAKGEDILIKSALKAVTGRDFEVEVE